MAAAGFVTDGDHTGSKTRRTIDFSVLGRRIKECMS